VQIQSRCAVKRLIAFLLAYQERTLRDQSQYHAISIPPPWVVNAALEANLRLDFSSRLPQRSQSTTGGGSRSEMGRSARSRI
jgi:hypothetical protein